jgi:hypothetical protein
MREATKTVAKSRSVQKRNETRVELMMIVVVVELDVARE